MMSGNFNHRQHYRQSPSRSINAMIIIHDFAIDDDDDDLKFGTIIDYDCSVYGSSLGQR